MFDVFAVFVYHFLVLSSFDANLLRVDSSAAVDFHASKVLVDAHAFSESNYGLLRLEHLLCFAG